MSSPISRPDITLKQLSALIAIGEAGRFRLAAKRCGISQPSLTQQLQSLEAGLGARLVERGRAGVALTPVGREISIRARQVLGDVEEIVSLAAAERDALIGTIRLGATTTLGPYLLPRVVAALHKKYPSLKLYIREGAAHDLEHQLRNGDHDAILTQLPVPGGGIVVEPLFREPLHLVMAPDHPLADLEAVPPKSLKGVEILSLNTRYQLYDQVIQLCDAFGAVLSRDYEGTSLDALRQMAGMGMGATFLPALYVQSEIRTRTEVAVRSIKGRRVERTIALVWRKAAGQAAHYKTLATYIRDEAMRKCKMLSAMSG